MVTDRTELDVQLHGEFADAGAISREAKVHASSAANLRELLAADHRYVFTLIHKFRLDAAAGETTMPVLSDRSDVIVITDEAHRSQYDTLALNMRRALPNASFMGFTGTPLIAGEELTRQQFGDYVSIYNFRDAIEDGATVPLYYENRIPELQLVNEDFADELDATAGGSRARRGRRGPAGPTVRPAVHAADPPRAAAHGRQGPRAHFVGRGFTGKAMYVGLDKAAAVRMYDYVQRGVGRAPRRAARAARRAARAGAAVAGQPHRADGDHRHGGRGLAEPERDRNARQARASTSARTASG